jgi:hypothetical protein
VIHELGRENSIPESLELKHSIAETLAATYEKLSKEFTYVPVSANSQRKELTYELSMLN